MKLIGTERKDTLRGTATNDWLIGLGGNDLLYGLGGLDLLQGQAGADTLDGGAGDDRLQGDAGDDRLDGGDGNDLLNGGAGRNTLRGGSGNDTYIVGAKDVIVEAQAGGLDTVITSGSRTLETYCNNMILVGTINATGNQFANVITGSAEANRIEGAAGIDQIDGGAGNDVLSGGADDDKLQGGAGNDTVAGGAGVDTLNGGAGDDRLDGGAGADLLWGDGGHDRLLGSDGEDNLNGGDGDDILQGGIGRDNANGGRGNDTYILRPGDGGDLLYVSSDYLYEAPGEGFDTIRIEGVKPTDVRIFFDPESYSPRLSVKAADGSVSYFTVTDLVDGFERITFDNGAVWDLSRGLTLTGTDGWDVFMGSSKADRFEGRGGRDEMYGRAGDDVLLGEDGADVLDGQGGNDKLFGGAGNDEMIERGDASDRNQLSGGAGNDLVGVSTGGTNVLNGDAGDDILGANTGNDTLIGGAGRDEMSGGAGDDTYILRAKESAAVADMIIEQIGGGTDTIRIIGLAPKDVTLAISPEQPGALRLTLKAADGTLSFADFWAHRETDPVSYNQRIERIAFDNGTIWDLTRQPPKFDNYEPHAKDDVYTAQAGKPLIVDAAHGLLANDSDPDGDTLTYSERSLPSHGKFVPAADGSFTFAPDAGFIGTAAFYYDATDGELKDMARVDITVRAAAAPERGAPAWDELAALAGGHPGDFDFA